MVKSYIPYGVFLFFGAFDIFLRVYASKLWNFGLKYFGMPSNNS